MEFYVLAAYMVYQDGTWKRTPLGPENIRQCVLTEFNGSGFSFTKLLMNLAIDISKVRSMNWMYFKQQLMILTTIPKL